MKLFLLSLILVFFTSSAHAQSMTTIRDAETEHVLRTYANIVFRAAGINSNSVDLIIVQDPSLNAFVSGGMKMFIHTGLIIESNDPLMLLGVMAHEAGHISGGHLVRRTEDIENAFLGKTISVLLGVAAIGAGAGKAGQAIMVGGTQAAQNNLLYHSRVQESSADQAGLNYLDRAKLSARGLLELLKTLSKREKMLGRAIDPYSVTHPLSQERVEHLENHLQTHPGNDASPEIRAMHSRMVGKLRGFLLQPDDVLKEYPASNISVEARYARAVAYHRKVNLQAALAEINSLITEFPQDPYFYEMKGQMLLERGKVDEASVFYKKALALLPGNALMQLELAIAELATEDSAKAASAATLLESVVAEEPRNVTAWHQLGVAYGRAGELGLSYLALAEEANLMGRDEEARDFNRLAQKHVEKDSPAYLRAKDLQRLMDAEKKKKSLF